MLPHEKQLADTDMDILLNCNGVKPLHPAMLVAVNDTRICLVFAGILTEAEIHGMLAAMEYVLPVHTTDHTLLTADCAETVNPL